MSRKDQAPEKRVKEMLLAGDPAADDADLGADERDRIRDRLSREKEAPRQGHGFRWQPAFALGAAVLLAAVLWHWLAPERVPPVSSPIASIPAPAPPPASNREQAEAPTTDREVRQIQFVTKGGTRVVWVLNPGFTL